MKILIFGELFITHPNLFLLPIKAIIFYPIIYSRYCQLVYSGNLQMTTSTGSCALYSVKVDVIAGPISFTWAVGSRPRDFNAQYKLCWGFALLQTWKSVSKQITNYLSSRKFIFNPHIYLYIYFHLQKKLPCFIQTSFYMIILLPLKPDI